MSNKNTSDSTNFRKNDSKRLFGKQMFPSRQSYDSGAYSFSDDTRSETSTLVDFRSDDSASVLKAPWHGELPVVGEMLDPEDMAWGPPTSSTPGAWSKFSQKWQNRRRQGSGSSSSSVSSSRSDRERWAQPLDPEDRAWSRK
ncbi:hypothetical protein VKT23_006411 [Stygiomarasmius scandens]|uniref:Uncharacterized protein n=1 Tax=Marasmiellus scandens TaxID=2682957 RepID=A0ABR1JMS2_9AGAR